MSAFFFSNVYAFILKVNQCHIHMKTNQKTCDASSGYVTVMIHFMNLLRQKISCKRLFQVPSIICPVAETKNRMLQARRSSITSLIGMITLLLPKWVGILELENDLVVGVGTTSMLWFRFAHSSSCWHAQSTWGCAKLWHSLSCAIRVAIILSVFPWSNVNNTSEHIFHSWTYFLPHATSKPISQNLFFSPWDVAFFPLFVLCLFFCFKKTNLFPYWWNSGLTLPSGGLKGIIKIFREIWPRHGIFSLLGRKR